MHQRFIVKWCETFDNIFESSGREAALAMTRDVLMPDDWEEVKEYFPTYIKEKNKGVPPQ